MGKWINIQYYSINSIGIICNLWLACLHLTHTHVHSPICETFSGWWGFPGGTNGNEPTCQCRRFRRCGVDPWVKKSPWRRKWQPSPVFLPEKSHGQRSLVDLSLWCHKESDTTEWLNNNNNKIHYWSGEGNGNPVQYSCLKNSMDRGTWQATVHSVAKRNHRNDLARMHPLVT